MKKQDIFRMTILAIGVWLGYKVLEILIYMINLLIELVRDDFHLGNDTTKYLATQAIFLVIYLVFAYLALRKTDKLMNFLNPEMNREVAEPAEENPVETKKPSATGAEILRIILTGIGALLFCLEVPELIYYLFKAFQSKVDPLRPDDFEIHYIFLAILRISFPVLLIVLSKRMASWLKF